MPRPIKLIAERIVSSSGRFSDRSGKSVVLFLAIILALRHLRADLLRRIEESARRLASTISHTPDRPMRENALVDVETEEIGNAHHLGRTADAASLRVAQHRRLGASVGLLSDRLIKSDTDSSRFDEFVFAN